MAAKNDVNGQGEADGIGDEIQRWTAGRKAAVVMDAIKGKATPADLARQHDLTVGEIGSWVEKFLEGGPITTPASNHASNPPCHRFAGSAAQSMLPGKAPTPGTAPLPAHRPPATDVAHAHT